MTDLERANKQLTRAILKKCLDCSGYDRAEAEACVISTCPLFPYRPRPIQVTLPGLPEEVFVQ